MKIVISQNFETMPSIVKLEQLVTKSDLKTAVVMVKRITLTTEQIQYFTKIKSVPKYASDFPTEIVEEKIRKPCVIRFSKKKKVSEKEHEQVLQENKKLIQGKQDDHESTMLPKKYVCITKEGIDDTPTNAGLTEFFLYLYDTLLKQSETNPERDIIGPFMVKPCKETYPDYYSVIKNPMDMETIKKRIKSSSYKTLKKFKCDVTLIFENCKAYNDPNSILHQDACELQIFFNKVYQSQITHREKHNSDKDNDKKNEKENDGTQTEKNCIQNESEGIQLMPQKSVMKILNPYTDGISSRESFQELQIPQNEEISEYEKTRLKNIAEQKAMFLNNLKKSALALSTSMTPKQAKQSKPKIFAPNTEPIVRSKRILERRSSAKENQNGDKPVTDSGGPEYKELPHKRRKSIPSRWGFNPNIDILQPEDITEEMLANVATPSIGKIRHEDGTTCHQCRIKTMDNKTVCRSGKCSGNRGMFCGTCLQNRYEQDARKALKDPNWWCPPCMNNCNCSICRTRIGKGATPKGTTQLAKERGFQSVHHYLKYKHTLIE